MSFELVEVSPEAVEKARNIMGNVSGLMWHIAEEVACHSRMTQDEAEDELRELLTEWTAAKIGEVDE